MKSGLLLLLAVAAAFAAPHKKGVSEEFLLTQNDTFILTDDQKCFVEGKLYEPWERVDDVDPCMRCVCDGYRGEPACQRIHCGWPICPDGADPVTKPGTCCPSCP